MTNFEAITKDLNTLADYMAINHMCDFCPAKFGTCDEQSASGERDLCRLNWREWLDEKAKETEK